LSIPAVQTAIAKRLTEQLNEDYGVDLQIDKVKINLSGAIILKDFIAVDEHKDTIFYGKRLQTYIRNPWKIGKQNRLALGHTHIDNLVGKIIYYEGKTDSNLDYFIKKMNKPSHTKRKGKAFLLEAASISLTNSRFQYFNKNHKNPKILDFKHLHAKLKNFELQGDKVEFQVTNMQMLDYRGIYIQNLVTDFYYDSHQIKLDKLQLDTDYSSIDMNLHFISPSKGYADFNNKVQLRGNIEEANISTTELRKLTDIFAPDHKIGFASQITGTLNDIKLKNFESITDNRIELDGNLNLKKIFNSQSFSIQAYLKKSQFSFDKLQQLMPQTISRNIPQELYVLGNISTHGDVSYNSKALKAKITSFTEAGDFDIDLKMNGLNNISQTNYEGHIRAVNFRLKKLIKQDFDHISTDFKVKGKGLTLAALNANFIGVITSVDFNNYTYNNITINGDVKKKLFQGQFEIADKNLEMDFSGLIDFSHPVRKMDFYTEICRAKPYELGFSKDELTSFQGDISLKAEGTNIDDITGTLSFNNVRYKNQYDTYVFNDFLITSSFDENKVRDIQFHSTDIVDGYLKGIFQFDNIPVLVKNAIGSIFANYEVKPLENEQYIKYNFKIHNKVIGLLVPDLKIAKNTYLKGKITSVDNKLKLKLISPKIIFNQKELVHVNLRIDNKNPLYNTFLKIDTINAGFYKFNNIRLLNTTINDTLYLKTKMDGGSKFDDHYDLSFYYTMDELQNFIFGLQKSNLIFKNIPWIIDPHVDKDKIFYNPSADSLSVENVAIMHSPEKVKVNGYKARDKINFDIDVDSINLAHITPELKDFKFEGLINGNIQISKYNNEILPSTELTINGLKINNEVLGKMILKMSTLPNNNIFVDMAIQDQDLQKLKLIGYVDMKKGQTSLNTSLLFQEFPVTPLQNLFKDIFSDIRGNMTGNVQIKGNLNDLSYDGKLYLNNFGLKILALNTNYEFENRSILNLHNQVFELKNDVFFDTKNKTKAKISGIIKHHNFNHWYLDLQIKTDNLLVLDTPEDPMEMYYGTVFVGGNARIHGYTDRLIIDADMQTKKNTDFVITLNDMLDIGEDDFVRIISKQEYQKEKQGKKKKHKIYEGLEMNFDLDITPDAQVEILMDIESGSTLVAKGSGAMLLEINTNGRFNMWGDFTVLEGIYNFRYSGVIDKKFKVEPGSYISWEGDPYAANLDITAVYETFADPSILLEDQEAKKMPVKVIIYLKDKLMHPSITFDLELPKANAILRSQIEYILSDPDKKTLQVLSLLSFGNFINENDYNLSNQAAEGLYKSISERGLNILNALMGQDENFQVNLNYSGGENNLERNVVTDPQVGLSLVTKINKRVYINGKVAVPVGRYTKSSIVGDVELEVYLDEKGNLVFRVFNKQTELEYIGQQEGYTQGIGISYQVDFDTFKEILQKIGIKIDIE